MKAEPLQLQVVVCPEDLGDEKSWSFYVHNQGIRAIGMILLRQIEWEWGNNSTIENPNAEISGLAPGAFALIWRDDDRDFRIALEFEIKMDDFRRTAYARLPALYRLVPDLTYEPGLKQLGYTVSTTWS